MVQCKIYCQHIVNIFVLYFYHIAAILYIAQHGKQGAKHIYIYGKHMNIYVLNIKQYLFHTNNIAKRRVSICNILQQYVIHIDHICLICSPYVHYMVNICFTYVLLFGVPCKRNTKYFSIRMGGHSYVLHMETYVFTVNP